MKKAKREKLKKLLNEILKNSFKHCETSDDGIAVDVQKINQAAHDCLKLIEHEPEDSDEGPTSGL